jgi:eukaryotic-like serine/threonine-protein kinase
VTSPEGADAALRPGAIVGEYQITHLLGEGGMGVVYAGTHPEIGKRVAIKVLAPHAAQYPDLIRRFKEEARAVNKIRHPNIIDIFAFNQLPDGRHYFVMEYLDGESLTARLERGSMEFAEMRRLLGQICGALEAAHEAGVVHRDLKPDNIWVATQHRSESRIKLLDFGIAKLNDLTGLKATQAGVPMGTPHYMPPEQGMGRAVDQRADIYALGVILYQIFAGTLPFDGVTAHEIVLKHVTEPPVPPSRHRPIAPAAMERIILDCLEKEPDRRPATVRELGERIDAAFAAENGTAARPGGTLIPRLPPAVLPIPGPGHTELLPDSRRVPGVVSAQPASPTTLRGSAGERVASDANLGATEIAAISGRGWRVPAAGIAAAAAVAIVVGVGFRGRHAPDAPVSAAAPMTAAATAPPAPAPSARAIVPPAAVPAPGSPPPPAEKPAPADLPTEAPAAKKVPAVAAATETPPTTHSHRHEHQRPVASTKTPPQAEPSTAPKTAGTAKPTVAKPDCTPNYYFDAQARKHFKPECF